MAPRDPSDPATLPTLALLARPGNPARESGVACDLCRLSRLRVLTRAGSEPGPVRTGRCAEAGARWGSPRGHRALPLSGALDAAGSLCPGCAGRAERYGRLFGERYARFFGIESV